MCFKQGVSGKVPVLFSLLILASREAIKQKKSFIDFFTSSPFFCSNAQTRKLRNKRKLTYASTWIFGNKSNSYSTIFWYSNRILLWCIDQIPLEQFSVLIQILNFIQCNCSSKFSRTYHVKTVTVQVEHMLLCIAPYKIMIIMLCIKLPLSKYVK